MKKIIDILGIVLPALIILLGIIRIFVKKTKGVNGLIMLFAFLLLLAGLIRYYAFPDRSNSGPDTKMKPVAVSKHSESFNRSVENVLESYYSTISQFVAGDTLGIRKSTISLKTSLDSFSISELQVDTLIYQTAQQPYENAKVELNALIADPALDEKRASLNILSNELFTLLSTIRYDLAKVYWLECNNAFGESRPGNWLSKTEQADNPYGQKNCVETRTTINFVPADTARVQ